MEVSFYENLITKLQYKVLPGLLGQLVVIFKPGMCLVS